jgi:hypothetical protein
MMASEQHLGIALDTALELALACFRQLVGHGNCPFHSNSICEDMPTIIQSNSRPDAEYLDHISAAGAKLLDQYRGISMPRPLVGDRLVRDVEHQERISSSPDKSLATPSSAP